MVFGLSSLLLYTCPREESTSRSILSRGNTQFRQRLLTLANNGVDIRPNGGLKGSGTLTEFCEDLDQGDETPSKMSGTGGGTQASALQRCLPPTVPYSLNEVVYKPFSPRRVGSAQGPVYVSLCEQGVRNSRFEMVEMKRGDLIGIHVSPCIISYLMLMTGSNV